MNAETTSPSTPQRPRRDKTLAISEPTDTDLAATRANRHARRRAAALKRNFTAATDMEVATGETESAPWDQILREPGSRPAAWDEIIRESACAQLTKLSRSTRWRLERTGRFPRRRQLSPGCIGWLRSEILAWMASR
jgi:predicted DNA-binding transcriptional regulator AlpA